MRVLVTGAAGFIGAAVAERLVMGIIEEACDRKAVVEMKPMQPGDVPRTFADIDAIARDLGYASTTPIETGFPRFVEWFRAYRGLR